MNETANVRGKVRVFFNDPETAEWFVKRKFPLLSLELNDDIVTATPDGTVCEMQAAAKKLEKFFIETKKLCHTMHGFFVLFGSDGFIMKYEPDLDGPGSFKFVSPNYLISLPVDEIKTIIADKLAKRI